MFYEVNTKNLLEEKEVGEGGSSINTSGLYEIVIENAIVKYNAQNARTIWLQYRLNGQSKSGGMLFVRLDNNDGSRNFQASIFEKLLVCNGIQKVGNLVKKEITTKKGTTKEDCVGELSGKSAIILVEASYRKYEGKIQESLNIRDVFRMSDKASFREILEGKPVGERIQELIDNKLVEVVVYKDGITAEMVAEWKKAQITGEKSDSVTSKVTQAITENSNPFNVPFSV